MKIGKIESFRESEGKRTKIKCIFFHQSPPSLFQKKDDQPLVNIRPPSIQL